MSISENITAFQTLMCKTRLSIYKDTIKNLFHTWNNVQTCKKTVMLIKIWLQNTKKGENKTFFFKNKNGKINTSKNLKSEWTRLFIHRAYIYLTWLTTMSNSNKKIKRIVFPCVTQIYRTQRSIGGYSKSVHPGFTQVMQLEAGTEKIHLFKSIVVFSAALQNTQCQSDQTRRESCLLISIAGQHLMIHVNTWLQPGYSYTETHWQLDQTPGFHQDMSSSTASLRTSARNQTTQVT